MTFLTRFRINAARRQARFLLSSPQAMHAAVLSAFPDEAATPAGDGARVLWRVDQSRHEQSLFIVSPARPDLTHLVEQAGWPTTEAWATREYDAFLGQLDTGQQYQFRLTANPVHQVRDQSGRPKRYGHVTAQQQVSWLTSRADAIGVAFPSGGLDPEERSVGISRREQRRFKRSGKTVTLTVAQYDGRLEVRDAELLRSSLRGGIGRAKAYGCGLMTLARG